MGSWFLPAILLVLPLGAQSAGGLDFHTLTPCRAINTNFGLPGSLIHEQERTFPMHGVQGDCDIPTTAKALAFNVTALHATYDGWLAIYPGDAELPPTSTVNFNQGQERASNAVIALSADGAGTLRAYAVLPPPEGTNIVGAVDLIVDVFGYFE